MQENLRFFCPSLSPDAAANNDPDGEHHCPPEPCVSVVYCRWSLVGGLGRSFVPTPAACPTRAARGIGGHGCEWHGKSGLDGGGRVRLRSSLRSSLRRFYKLLGLA